MDHYILQCDDFHTKFTEAFRSHLDEGNFVDVTLAAEESFLRAHKVVLSGCSGYFKRVLQTTPDKHPVIILYGIKAQELAAILQFMYTGRTSIPHQDLRRFMCIGRELEIKGLEHIDSSSNDSHEGSPSEGLGTTAAFGISQRRVTTDYSESNSSLPASINSAEAAEASEFILSEPTCSGVPDGYAGNRSPYVSGYETRVDEVSFHEEVGEAVTKEEMIVDEIAPLLKPLVDPLGDPLQGTSCDWNRSQIKITAVSSLSLQIQDASVTSQDDQGPGMLGINKIQCNTDTSVTSQDDQGPGMLGIYKIQCNTDTSETSQDVKGPGMQAINRDTSVTSQDDQGPGMQAINKIRSKRVRAALARESFQCSICGKVFTRNEALEAHITVVHDKQSRSIAKTLKQGNGKRLKHNTGKGKLQGQSKVPPQTNPIHRLYFCDICDNSFSCRMDLLKHNQKYHAVVKGPLLCPRCYKAFKNMHSLRSHLYHTCSDEKEKSIPRRRMKIQPIRGPGETRNLRSLASTVPDSSTYNANLCCMMCKESFLDTADMLGHSNMYHVVSGRLTCPICGKDYKNRRCVTSHFYHTHNLKVGRKNSKNIIKTEVMVE